MAVSDAIRGTTDGLRNNRSDLLAAIAAEGELGRARQAEAQNNLNTRQRAQLSQAASVAEQIAAPTGALDDVSSYLVARNSTLDNNREAQNAAYERALASTAASNSAYIDQIGAGSVLQAQQLDADYAAAQQLLDAQAAAAASARRGGGGGYSSSPDKDLTDAERLAALIANETTSGVGNLESAARRAQTSNLNALMADDNFGYMMDDIEILIANTGRPPTATEIYELARKYEQGWEGTNVASQFFINRSLMMPTNETLATANRPPSVDPLRDSASWRSNGSIGH